MRLVVASTFVAASPPEEEEEDDDDNDDARATASSNRATLAATAARAGLAVTRMRLFDRSPLSDSLYAVFARDPAAERSLPRPVHAAA